VLSTRARQLKINRRNIFGFRRCGLSKRISGTHLVLRGSERYGRASFRRLPGAAIDQWRPHGCLLMVDGQAGCSANRTSNSFEFRVYFSILKRKLNLKIWASTCSFFRTSTCVSVCVCVCVRVSVFACVRACLCMYTCTRDVIAVVLSYRDIADLLATISSSPQ